MATAALHYITMQEASLVEGGEFYNGPTCLRGSLSAYWFRQFVGVEPDGMGVVLLGEQHLLVPCLIGMLEKNLQT